MYALLAEVSFCEAHFREHFTEVNPLTYPAMLPTTVAGLFGAMLGWDRKEAEKKAKDFLFGSKLIELKGITHELARITQYKAGKPKIPSPLVKVELLVEPKFLIAMAGKKERILECAQQLKNGMRYLPYGGRNEHFLRDIATNDVLQEVTRGKIIENYAPIDWVEEVKVKESRGWVRTHRVFHKINRASEWFVFGYLCTIHLKNTVPQVERIGLYSLNNFYWHMKV